MLEFFGFELVDERTGELRRGVSGPGRFMNAFTIRAAGPVD
jgi:hypothetical protein